MFLRHGVRTHQDRKVKRRGTEVNQRRVHFIYSLLEPSIVTLRIDELTKDRQPGQYRLIRTLDRAKLAILELEPTVELPQIHIYPNPINTNKLYIELRLDSASTTDYTIIDFSTRKLRRFIRRVEKLAAHSRGGDMRIDGLKIWGNDRPSS